MTLRPYHASDLDRLMELWLTANLSAHPFIDPRYWHDSAALVRRLLPDAQIIVYEADNTVAGFIGITADGYIAGLFVDGPRRGAGIGKALVDRAKAAFDCLTLSVYTENAGAVRFYLREGFVIAATETQPETGAPEHHMRWVR